MVNVPLGITATDYTPAAMKGEPALSAASLTTLRLEAEKQRNKEVHQLKLSMPKFFSRLWESMSIESKEEVSQHTRFIEADLLHENTSESRSSLDYHQRNPFNEKTWRWARTSRNRKHEEQVRAA
jgi:hypothetical protein